MVVRLTFKHIERHSHWRKKRGHPTCRKILFGFKQYLILAWRNLQQLRMILWIAATSNSEELKAARPFAFVKEVETVVQPEPPWLHALGFWSITRKPGAGCPRTVSSTWVVILIPSWSFTTSLLATAMLSPDNLSCNEFKEDAHPFFAFHAQWPHTAWTLLWVQIRCRFPFASLNLRMHPLCTTRRGNRNCGFGSWRDGSRIKIHIFAWFQGKIKKIKNIFTSFRKYRCEYADSAVSLGMESHKLFSAAAREKAWSKTCNGAESTESANIFLICKRSSNSCKYLDEWDELNVSRTWADDQGSRQCLQTMWRASKRRSERLRNSISGWLILRSTSWRFVCHHKSAPWDRFHRIRSSDPQKKRLPNNQCGTAVMMTKERQEGQWLQTTTTSLTLPRNFLPNCGGEVITRT